MENELGLLRLEIDDIDAKIIELLKARMTISEKVADYKICRNMEIIAPEREAQLLERVGSLSGEEYSSFILKIYENILAQSRECQQRKMSFALKPGEETHQR